VHSSPVLNPDAGRYDREQRRRKDELTARACRVSDTVRRQEAERNPRLVGVTRHQIDTEEPGEWCSRSSLLMWP
jgi:hypothetical protein